jgi:hypothetical protein
LRLASSAAASPARGLWARPLPETIPAEAKPCGLGTSLSGHQAANRTESRAVRRCAGADPVLDARSPPAGTRVSSWRRRRSRPLRPPRRLRRPKRTTASAFARWAPRPCGNSQRCRRLVMWPPHPLLGQARTHTGVGRTVAAHRAYPTPKQQGTPRGPVRGRSSRYQAFKPPRPAGHGELSASGAMRLVAEVDVALGRPPSYVGRN